MDQSGKQRGHVICRAAVVIADVRPDKCQQPISLVVMVLCTAHHGLRLPGCPLME